MDILLKNKTMTSQFLMPLLFEDKQFNKIIPDYKSFVNAYIADFDRPKNDNKIVLVFKTKQKDLPELKRVDSYTKKVKDVEKYCYVYEIPDDLMDNYAFWLLGKYSMFTDKAKKIICDFWEAGKNTLIWGVLHKKGTAVPKYMKKNFNTNIDGEWSNDENEWWVSPQLSHEIYGAE
jgi:hypothetical protein